MTTSLSGIASYQQTSQIWKKDQNTSVKEKTGESVKSQSPGSTTVSEGKPVSKNSPLIPTNKAGYGTVIGDVELSDEAREYYDKLKSKFHGMDFILVSKDMKSQVAANPSAFGNAIKPVVLIDDEKLEKMSNDESFRKKYEGIIAMSQTKLQEAKNSLVSSGATVKNFGMQVGSDGKISFFATLEKANSAQTKYLEKKQAEKKAAKAKEKKQAEKEALNERIEKRREENKAEKESKEVTDVREVTEEIELTEDASEGKEYIEFRSENLDDLVNSVAKYAYYNLGNNVLAEEETLVGQNIDFRG